MIETLLKRILITATQNDKPTEYADKLGRVYIESQKKDHIKSYGQYLTPPVVAHFMANLFDLTGLDSEVSILEPGAGTGTLSIAICERLIELKNRPKKVSLVAYELDEKIIPLLEKSLLYLKSRLKKNKINFSYKIVADDFIIKNSNMLSGGGELPFQSSTKEFYDLIISNPPYFKISKSDPRSKVAETVVHGQPNIYALFMAVAVKMTKINGQVVFITPRSYTAGPYFRLFREKFFNWLQPTNIHLFESRKDAFNRDKVLQENVILKGKRVEKLSQQNYQVQISFSNGLADLERPEKISTPISELIDMDSKDKILHIPIRHRDRDNMSLVRSWKFNLHSLGLEVSTGPIVSFRAKNSLIENGNLSNNFAPLFLIHNIVPMNIRWPMQKSNKPQFFKISPDAESLLLPNKNYVLLRRFSAKEEPRRLVAAPYSAQISTHHLGLENHLNYIYKSYGELLPEEIYGLAALLNSEILDNYFRTFNGNTQVNASELRRIPLPDLETIKFIGRQVMVQPTINSENLDLLINKILIKN